MSVQALLVGVVLLLDGGIGFAPAPLDISHPHRRIVGQTEPGLLMAKSAPHFHLAAEAVGQAVVVKPERHAEASFATIHRQFIVAVARVAVFIQLCGVFIGSAAAAHAIVLALAAPGGPVGPFHGSSALLYNLYCAVAQAIADAVAQFDGALQPLVGRPQLIHFCRGARNASQQHCSENQDRYTLFHFFSL